MLTHIELLSPMLTHVDTYYLTADERRCSRCSGVVVWWWWTAQFWVLVTAVVLLSCCGGVINSSHPGRDASSEQCLLPSPLLSIHLAPHPRSRNHNIVFDSKTHFLHKRLSDIASTFNGWHNYFLLDVEYNND